MATSNAAFAQTGRKLGPRALKTRARLLDAAAELFKERSVLDLSAVEIARKVGTSPATFYHYFKDVEEVALALAERAAAEMPAILELVRGPWQGEEGLETTRAIVRAFVDHWDKHHAVLQLRNLAADRGDTRFVRVRRDALGPFLDRLAEAISGSKAAGHIATDLHPYVAAASIGSMLERLAAYHNDLKRFEVGRTDVIETCAQVFHQIVTGRS